MSLEGSGGLTVSTELTRLTSQPGYLSQSKGSQRIRDLYVNGSYNFNVNLLNRFAMACCLGQLQAVTEIVESGRAPDLTSTETPYKFGYATLVISGAMRIQRGPNLDHVGVLKYLLKHGAPPDVEDISGYTALHHGTMHDTRNLQLARILLENGANVNHRDKFGVVPIMNCFQTNLVDAVELLMEFGADLDIADADGVIPRKFFLQCGPKITATVTKCLRKRSGEEALLVEKKCDNCGSADVPLKMCSKCHTARYCSRDCQRAHWSVHKKGCSPFASTNTISLKPFYRESGHVVSMSDVTRSVMGINSDANPPRTSKAANTPNPKSYSASQPKAMIIKVQVPWGLDISAQSRPSNADLLVYNKKRDFVCSIRLVDNPDGYERISSVVRTKGVGGAKAYFAAELRGKDELVVKIDEVLAEQPF